MQALKRIGQPDDVGSVVAFLASQDAPVDHRRHHPRRWRLEALNARAKTHFGFFCCSIFHRHMRAIT